jgi:hypothetical protein
MPQPSRQFAPFPCDLVMRFPRNWTAIVFLSVMAFLHLANAIPAFLRGQLAGHLSALLASIMIAAAIGLYRLRCEVSVRPSRGEVRLSTRLLLLWSEQVIPFAAVRGVRVFVPPEGSGQDALIELLTADGDIDCPASKVPRQQALCLAMTLGVELIKVCPDDQEGQAESEPVMQ